MTHIARAIIGGACLLTGAVLATATSPPPPVPANPYGVLISVGGRLDDADLQRMLSRVRDAGVGAVRADFFWHLIEPTPGVFRWARYDALVRMARQHGVDVLGILDYSADWASRDSQGKDLKHPPKHPEDFAGFAAATAARYRDSITFWEIWNEPDSHEFWKGSAADYATLLSRSYRAIKRANPAAKVLLGGLAQGGSYDPAFLDKVLDTCGGAEAECFDILAFHTNFRGPDEIRAQFAANRRSLSRHGRNTPIWITESSYTSDPRHQTLAAYRDGEAGQARYIRDTVSLSLSLGAERIVWAGLSDYGDGQDGPYAASGLLRADYRPKLAYEAYRALAAARKARSQRTGN